MSKYRVAYFCTTCHHELTLRTVYGNNGVCPYCLAESDNHVVEIVERMYVERRARARRSWWRHFFRPYHQVREYFYHSAGHLFSSGTSPRFDR